MPRSSQYPVLGLILLVSRKLKIRPQTLAMATINIFAKTSIKPIQYIANMITNTYIPLKHVYDARIVVIEFEIKVKPYELQCTILDASILANDWDSFSVRPGCDCWP